MSYQFSNEIVVSQLSSGPVDPFPEPDLRLITRLRAEVRRHEFGASETGVPEVRVHEREADEIAKLVDWSAEILNFCYSLDVSINDLVSNQPTADGQLSMEAAMNLFETWFEYAEAHEGPIVTLSTYPSCIVKRDPLATVGNLCAALGLAVLDSLPVELRFHTSGTVMKRIHLAWELALLARAANAVAMSYHLSQQALAASANRPLTEGPTATCG